MIKRVIVFGGLGILVAAALVYPLVRHRDTDVSASSGGPPPAPVVQTVVAATHPMARTIRISGSLKSGSESSVSPKQGGKILSLLVKEGQSVKRGQVLARLDAADSRQQAQQATAGVAAARAAWEKAITGERLKRDEIERRIQDARRGVEQAQTQLAKAEAGVTLQQRSTQADVSRAQAGVDAARAALQQAKRGARPEQKRQAEIQVRQAERGVQQAKQSLDDLEFLYKKGGVPRVQLDEAREGYRKAQDGLEQARAQLDLLKAGATAEDIAAAEAQVRSAEAALDAARAGADRGGLDKADLAAARTQLKQAQDGLSAAIASRSELDLARRDVEAAQAAYRQALAGSRLAAQQVDASVLLSPLDGMVTAVNGNPGEMAGPGQPLITVVGTAGVYLDAAAGVRDIADLHSGQPAAVTVAALAGKTFPGVVRSIAGTAGPDGRSYPVRIDLSAPAGLLRPGSLAQADVTVASYPDAITVPVDSLRPEGQAVTIRVVRDGKIVAVPVEVPLQDTTRAMVRGAVRAGETVVLSGDTGLKSGTTVRAEPVSSH